MDCVRWLSARGLNNSVRYESLCLSTQPFHSRDPDLSACLSSAVWPLESHQRCWKSALASAAPSQPGNWSWRLTMTETSGWRQCFRVLESAFVAASNSRRRFWHHFRHPLISHIIISDSVSLLPADSSFSISLSHLGHVGFLKPCPRAEFSWLENVLILFRVLPNPGLLKRGIELL